VKSVTPQVKPMGISVYNLMLPVDLESFAHAVDMVNLVRVKVEEIIVDTIDYGIAMDVFDNLNDDFDDG
jgi:hypothetical protein